MTANVIYEFPTNQQENVRNEPKMEMTRNQVYGILSDENKLNTEDYEEY